MDLEDIILSEISQVENKMTIQSLSYVESKNKRKVKKKIKTRLIK